MGNIQIKGLDGRLIGELREDGVLVCHKKESAHLFRKFNSLCIATFTLEKLASGQIRTEKTNIPCNKVRVILEMDKSGGGEVVYETTPQAWLEFGSPIQYGDWETQTSLPLDRWQKIEPAAEAKVEEEPVVVSAKILPTWQQILKELKIEIV